MYDGILKKSLEKMLRLVGKKTVQIKFTNLGRLAQCDSMSLTELEGS